MSKFPQNKEQEYIINYFDNYKGAFLDLGAKEGIELSKTRPLMECGWSGMCFEHRTEMHDNLKVNCNQFPFVFVYDFAVGFAEKDYKINEKVTNFKNLLIASPFSKFDFISIDCGEMNYAILSQINLDDIKCNMLCIATNGALSGEYIKYCEDFGMSVLHENQENLIMAR